MSIFVGNKKFLRALSILAVFFGCVSVPLSSQAAVVSNASDLVSTLQVGNNANHTVTFTTPTGASEGTTITLTFESGFDLSSINKDDVDITDDGTDLSTAGSCLTTPQASVTIADQVVTLTLCAGGGGTIAAGSVVAIEIGDHATAYGTGSNRIQNMTTAGTSFVTIGGTFGDFGSIAIPILAGSDQGVFATVPYTGPSGGPPPTGTPADTTAPVICCIVVSGITENSATINWGTNEPTTGFVDYGVTASYEIGSVASASLLMSHGVALSGLLPGRLYHFRVRATDAAGNTSSAFDFLFETGDTTPPLLLDVHVEDIGTQSATVVWSTNEEATSEVEYGLTSSYGLPASTIGFSVTHRVPLLGLLSGTMYHLRAASEDPSENRAQSADLSFQTLSDLPPNNVSNFIITPGINLLTFSWVNPTDTDFTSLTLRCRTDRFPQSSSDGFLVFEGLASAAMWTGLTAGVQQWCGIFALDAAGQFSSGAFATGTPLSPPEPLPEEPPIEEEPPPPSEETPPSPPTAPIPPSVQPPVNPETTVSSERRISEESLFFQVAQDTLTQPVQEATVSLLAGLPVAVMIESPLLADAEVESASIIFASFRYGLLRESGNPTRFVGRFSAPDEPGLYRTFVQIVYRDQTRQTWTRNFSILPRGQVRDGRDAPVPGVQIVLYQDARVFDVSPFGQWNPTETDGQGRFAWYVPEGDYEIRVQQGDQFLAAQAVPVNENHIARADLRLTRVLTDEGEVLSGVSRFPGALAQLFVELDTSPMVTRATQGASLLLGLAAAAQLLVLASAFDLLRLLQYLFTSPFLFWRRRRREAFGVVYQAFTKLPVDLALVRLLDAATGRIVKTAVTDRNGRYLFLAPEGNWRVVVTKMGYQFPSQVLGAVKTDGPFLDVYHGEVVTVTEQNSLLSLNIPLDPILPEGALTPKAVKKGAWWRGVQQGSAVGGLLLSGVVVFLRPSWFSIGLALLQIAVYLLVWRLATPPRPRGWGIIYDKMTGRPLSEAVVRVFEPVYQKVLQTMVTDRRGRYATLLGPGEFYSTIEKEGYEPGVVRPLRVSDVKKPGAFTSDIPLAPIASPPPEQR